MSFSSVESALYVHVVRVRRNACASLVFGGEAQTTRIATVCAVRSFGTLPVTSSKSLNADLEVKVVGCHNKQKDKKRLVQSSSAL